MTLKRFGHSIVHLLVAGIYTPCRRPPPTWASTHHPALGHLDKGASSACCSVVSGPTLCGLLYIALGWCLAPVLGTLGHHAGSAVLALVVTGGGLYTLGAVVYATKRPNPSPTWFGFHEIFQSLTIVAWTVQHIAIALLILRLR